MFHNNYCVHCQNVFQVVPYEVYYVLCIGESDLTYSYSLCRTCSSDTGERGGSSSCCFGNRLPWEVAVATPGCSFGRTRGEGSASLQGQTSHPVINQKKISSTAGSLRK